MPKKDDIFNNPIDKIVDFKFDEKVANVFEDMLNRSIPGYSTIISIIGMLTKLYEKPNSNYYDLGSSLGAAALSMRRNISYENCKVIAVDNSEAMINRVKELTKMDNSKIPIEFICEDIRRINIENASVVVLNFTLQFIDPEGREEMLKQIYNGLNKNGLLILSEKVKFENNDLNERQIKRYHDFKKLHGYSDLEISQKRDTLENVLIPDSTETHIKRLQNAGFSKVDLWYQTFNFISIIAEK